MPIAINGSAGTITGISTGGLPDGCVDTDTLANNAVTAAKSTGLQRRISTGPTALAGQSSLTHTVTAGVKKIEVLFQDSSSNSNSNMKLVLGDSGGLESSGYGYASGLHRTGTSSREGTVTNFTDSFQTYGLDATTYNIFGTWKLWNPHGNTWVSEHILWGDDATNHTFYGNGYKTLSGTITSVYLATLSGVFSDGNITIVETMGDD
tara:strand:+ start:55 stop:675 length:621 start_codon:yes stop_codon:yes gene_type:complete